MFTENIPATFRGEVEGARSSHNVVENEAPTRYGGDVCNGRWRNATTSAARTQQLREKHLEPAQLLVGLFEECHYRDKVKCFQAELLLLARRNGG